MVNGSQCSIMWHIDNCIATHQDQKELDGLGKQMIEYFGDMNVTSGSKHDFLGMKLHLRNYKKLEIDMSPQVIQLVQDFERDNEIILNDKVSSPATANLFNVDDTEPELSHYQTKQFQSTTAKLLYIMKQGHPDIKIVVSF